MTDTTLNVAGAIANSTHALKFGRAGKASADAVAAQATILKKAGIKPAWIPTDEFTDGNPVHLECFEQIAEGRLTKRDLELAKMTKQEAKGLTEKQKLQRDTSRRVVRRMTMSFLTAVRVAMEGGKAVAVDTTRTKKAEWTQEQRVMGGLLAIHDALSGTGKAPATSFHLKLQQALKPAIDLLRSKHGEAATVYNGFGQQYKGSFGIRKTK